MTVHSYRAKRPRVALVAEGGVGGGLSGLQFAQPIDGSENSACRGQELQDHRPSRMIVSANPEMTECRRRRQLGRVSTTNTRFSFIKSAAGSTRTLNNTALLSSAKMALILPTTT